MSGLLQRGRYMVELACGTEINNEERKKKQNVLQIPSKLLETIKPVDLEVHNEGEATSATTNNENESASMTIQDVLEVPRGVLENWEIAHFVEVTTHDAQLDEAASATTSNDNGCANMGRPLIGSVPEHNNKNSYNNESRTHQDHNAYCQKDHTYDDEDWNDSVQDPDYTPHLDSGNEDEHRETKDIEEENGDNSNVPEKLDGQTTQNKKGGRPKKGRKRKHVSQTCQSRKKLKDSNKPHFVVKGTYCSPKKFNDFNCNCPKRCKDIVNIDSRKKMFEKFWNLGSYDCQTAFIAAHIKEVNVKRKRSSSNKRQFTRKYELDKVNVCREMFTHTLGVSTKRVNTSLNKIRSDCVTDKRGTHRKGVPRIPPVEIQKIKDHINKFPRYKSHYCRRVSGDTEYLSTELTESKMYELYKEENEGNGAVSFSCYRMILHRDFNIKRKKLKKDTCNACDRFHAAMQNCNNIEKETIMNELNVHQSEAEEARDAMNRDLKTAKECENVETLCYDMEKTLPLPRIPTNIIYYKRQIWVYNTGIHSGKESKSFFYVWVEGTAGRGAQEVGSSLRKHIVTHVGRNVTDIILWSDSCGGQNRNIKMVLMMNTLFDELNSLNSVTLKYLASGHTYLPNDSDFGDVESALKQQQRLYTLEDYIKVMEGCRKKGKFVVTQMQNDDFKGTSEIEKEITNRKIDTEGNKINWLTVRQIKLERCKPQVLQMKTSHSQETFIDVNINKNKRRGRPSDGFQSSKLISLWPEGKPISKEKLKDIKSIRHLIPQGVWHFYQKFQSSTEVEDDIDGFGNNADFTMEDE